MENQLPTEFDVVLIGTGMIESIVSAAASRVGKNVLHIDCNDYYGSQWASFNLRSIHSFLPSSYEAQESQKDHKTIGNKIFNIQNFETQWHIPKTEPNTPDLIESPQETQQQTLYTQSKLLDDSRKFNIDLVPKLHFAKGEFVELLISSNIARYVEYRSVSRVLTYLNGQLEVVPCSRSDVFANSRVSVIEKRMLMKLLTSLDEIDDTLNDKDITFKKYLSSKKLSDNLIHFILYAMARSTSETSLAEGIERTKQFLNSLGRFGKTPMLFSMYGSGETPQAFCRLSAVFGGIYALNQETQLSIKVESNSIKFLQNGKQEIKAEKFVVGAEYTPQEFVKAINVKHYIARAIFITDQSVMPIDHEHLTLLMYPPEEGKNIVTIIETGSHTGTCPKNLFLVHFTAKQLRTPRDDFQHIIKNLFNINDSLPNRPKILWSCYFSIPLTSDLKFEDVPENMFVCSGPDMDLDYDSAIKKGRSIFQKMYPDLEFLPRAPDPEEIIFGEESTSEGAVINNETSDVQ
ncbi:rab proteins geranylgeranyltransferase component A isoform X2 [Euwallacea similis]|uniref:rab proteins geranylgeranyltransferase component A isoform X2 n=1 Tax=Euwallacea similis TaxID=1736056 RepID=UPI00344CE333